MIIIKRRSAQLSVAAVAALAIFAVTAAMLLAGGFNTSPAQAQSTTYPDPQPCGQGHAAVPEKPAKQITEGEIALFDAYWDLGTNTLNNNLCPPEIVRTTTKKGKKVVPIVKRSDANIDIAKTVIHVTEDYKVTVVNSAADNYDPEAVAGPTIDVNEYIFLREALGLGVNEAPEPNTKVYWLRLDDPDTTGEDENETSDLVLGFSTELFDKNYWEPRGNLPAVQYEYESERDDIYEVHGPHFFAFDAPKKNNGEQIEAIWSSVDADVNHVDMGPGERKNLQWIFTEPGTHHIQVHVKGHVRQNPPEGAGNDWEKIAPDERTVASEVRLYTIQAGPLNFNKQPMFQVERTVAENSPSGTKVGDPVAVAMGDDGDTLTYGLDGKGSSHFEVQPVPGGAQITVATGAMLDYETMPVYDLVLGVSDGKNLEGGPDPSLDNEVALKIQLEDVTGPPTVAIQVDDTAPSTDETVTFTSSYSGDIPALEHVDYDWVERKVGSDETNTLGDDSSASVSVTHSTAGHWRYQLHLSWPGSPGEVPSNILNVTWTD